MGTAATRAATTSRGKLLPILPLRHLVTNLLGRTGRNTERRGGGRGGAATMAGGSWKAVSAIRARLHVNPDVNRGHSQLLLPPVVLEAEPQCRRYNSVFNPRPPPAFSCTSTRPITTEIKPTPSRGSVPRRDPLRRLNPNRAPPPATLQRLMARAIQRKFK